MNTNEGSIDPIHKKDIEQRQKLIDRLYFELDRKTDALQKLGKDLVSARESNQQLQEEIQKSEQKLQDSDLKTKRLISTFDIDIIPIEELRRRYALLSRKLESALEQIKDQSEKIEQFDSIMSERDKLDNECNALRKAHTAQQTLVLNLQETVQKSAKFKTVITKQEVVISKLEAQIEELKRRGTVIQSNVPLYSTSDHTSPRDSLDGTEKDQVSLLQKENADLKEELKAQRQRFNSSPTSATDSGQIWNILKQENARLKEQIRQHETNQSKQSSQDVLRLIMRAESAEAKCKALEIQLIESSKEFGKQIRELKSLKK